VEPRNTDGLAAVVASDRRLGQPEESDGLSAATPWRSGDSIQIRDTSLLQVGSAVHV
jgi:hypothetical protein